MWWSTRYPVPTQPPTRRSCKSFRTFSHLLVWFEDLCTFTSVRTERFNVQRIKRHKGHGGRIYTERSKSFYNMNICTETLVYSRTWFQNREVFKELNIHDTGPGREHEWRCTLRFREFACYEPAARNGISGINATICMWFQLSIKPLHSHSPRIDP